MKITGRLHKMHTELLDPVRYSLEFDQQTIVLNDAIGHELKLTYTGKINCIHCNREIKKSFNQGYCFPCLRRLAQCDMCIVKPELCHFDEGTCREPEWGEANCFQDHFVYLANSSGIKVGITRHSQLHTRWMDQGATSALPILKVKSRKISGLMEVAFKDHVADKTSWQKMLKGTPEPHNLEIKRDELLEKVAGQIDTLKAELGDDSIEIVTDQKMVEINFPVETYPEKIKSFNFDKSVEVSGILNGIKGQYLIFDRGVINIRKFAGYEVEIQSEPISA